jgi:hypothetical protein
MEALYIILDFTSNIHQQSDEIFLGYQPCQVSVLNQHFKDHLSHHHKGSDESTKPLVSHIYTSAVG